LIILGNSQIIKKKTVTQNMAWNKIKIQRENGEFVDAQTPIIISASRSTDIPAFYADWFFHRLKLGYSAWTNPFNGVKNYVSYNNTRFIVFWSKNPKPLLTYLDELKERHINCYIQFTLNDYVAEGLEKGVPPLDERIETFHKLVEKLGFGHVVWRFDPLILTDQITINDLLHKIEYIGDQLYGKTEKLVFSFADITSYRKVKSNLEKNGVHYYEFTKEIMKEFASRLSELNKKWGYTLATCGEKIDIEDYGIHHNRCVDDDLMIKYFSNDTILMKHLGVTIENELFNSEPVIKKSKSNADKGQRQFCDCIASKDIGEYNTCPHLCEYCYANSTKEIALKNWKNHLENKFGETITGK
jgi:DNA repair photolyase